METAKPRELTTLHLGKISKTHGSKSHHGLRKWVCFNFIDLWKTQSSSLHHPSSMTSFRTAFSNEHMNRITEERSRVNCPRESVCLRIGPCYDSCPESERYRTSVVLMFSLHRITYTECIRQLELSIEKRLTRLQNDSTMDLISFTKVAREVGVISF